MSNFLEVLRGNVTLNDQSASVVRGIIAGEIRPVLDILASLVVEIQELKDAKLHAETVKVTVTGSSSVVGYDVIPRYSLTENLSDLHPEDKAREEMRRAIAVKMFEYAAAAGISVGKDNVGSVYAPFYKKLKENTGYAPEKPKAFEYLNPYSTSKINTLIDDGYGQQLIDLVDLEIAKLKSAGGSRRRIAPKAKKPRAKEVVKAVETVVTPEKKKRGRPRKVVVS